MGLSIRERDRYGWMDRGRRRCSRVDGGDGGGDDGDVLGDVLVVELLVVDRCCLASWRTVAR